MAVSRDLCSCSHIYKQTGLSVMRTIDFPD